MNQCQSTYNRKEQRQENILHADGYVDVSGIQPLFTYHLKAHGDNASQAGLGMALIGVAVEGVGAAPGLAVAAYGGVVNAIGTGMEVLVEVITNDYSENNTGKAISKEVGNKVLNEAIDGLIPGPTPNATPIIKESIEVGKEIIKYTGSESIETQLK